MTAPFPMTRASAVADLVSGEPARRERALDVVAVAYWRPVYAHVRLRWRKQPAEAEDLTQGFFVTALDRDALAAYDPARGRFRTFLRACLDRYVIDRHRHATAARRGGGVSRVELAAAEAELVDHAAVDVEEVFDAAWVRALLGLAFERLETRLTARGKATHVALFREFHLADQPPSYAEAAARHGLALTDVTNWLHVARSEFRAIALDLLRELTASEAEFADEARAVFGLETDATRP